MEQSQKRTGARGGKDRFDWSEVKTMDHRERACYLGASVNAIRKSWRWWEEKDLGEAPAPASSSEVQNVKQMEEQMIMQALGLMPTPSQPKQSATAGPMPAPLDEVKKITGDLRVEPGRAGLGSQPRPSREHDDERHRDKDERDDRRRHHHHRHDSRDRDRDKSDSHRRHRSRSRHRDNEDRKRSRSRSPDRRKHDKK